MGISPDPPERHRAFREALGLPFLLVSDPAREIIRLYDSQRPFGLGVRRITYVVDGKGMIRNAFQHEICIGRHVADVLETLQTIKGELQHGPWDR